MRLAYQSDDDVISGGVKPLQESTYRTSANNTVFKVITKGLYSRPKAAIVREIGTNCLDAHEQAGVADKPFDIHLPTAESPYLIFRDYGVSMDNETVFNVYGVVGESTKNDSDTSVGGWGLGGKSPAAYTHTFYINTYLDGVKRIYRSTINTNSAPLALLAERPTDEPNGVEVKIPIKERDFNDFHEAVEAQIASFDVKPNVHSAREINYPYDINDPKTHHCIDVTALFPVNGVITKDTRTLKVHMIDSVYNSNIREKVNVRMGCVVYPLTASTSENSDQFKVQLDKLEQFVSGNAIIDLPLDTVEVMPDREELNYDESRTVEAITGICRSLTRELLRQSTTFFFKNRHKHPLLLSKMIDEKFKGAYYIKNLLHERKVKSQGLRQNKYIRLEKAQSIYNREAEDTALSKYVKSPLAKLDPLVTYSRHSIGTVKGLRVYANGKTKAIKFNQIDLRTSFPASSIIMYRRCSNMLAKLEYMTDESNGEIGDGISLGGPYISYPVLLVDPDYEDLYVSMFSDFFNVEVRDIPEIPKEHKEVYKKDQSFNKSVPEIRVKSFSPNGETKNTTEYLSYSLKSVNLLIEKYSKEFPNAELILDIKKEDYLDLYDLRTLSESLEKHYIVIKVTPSLYDKVKNSDKVNITPSENFIKNTLKAISFNQILQWEEAYIKYFLRNKLIDYSTNPIWQYALKDQPFRNLIFGFTNKYLVNKTKDPEYFLHLYCDYSNSAPRFYAYLDKLQKQARVEFAGIKKRINKRTSLLLQHKPVLQLLNNSYPEATKQLLLQNFEILNHDPENN